MERCPFCRGQLISCGCEYKHFYPSYVGIFSDLPTAGLPREVYENGLPLEQETEWDRILEAKGRHPYVVSPNLCSRCGQLWPDMFMVDDWPEVIPLPLRDEMLCRDCYELIKGFVEEGRRTI